MASAIETVTTFMQELESKEFEKAASHLSDSFFFTGFTPQPLNKPQLISVMSGLSEGFPNLLFNLQNVHEGDDTMEGKRVTGIVKLMGTHTDTFVLPALGLAPIPETAISISLPEESWEYLLKGEIIASIQVKTAPGGDIEGLLNQLGISDPIYQ